MKNNHEQKNKKKSTIGMWVERPRRMAILLCVCGNKYVKTRAYQTMCIKCVYKRKEKK